MINTLTAITLFVLGSIFGSFAGAQVWRLRSLQLRTDKKSGEEVDEYEFTRLKKLFTKKFAADRSRCLDCGTNLKWYDLLPIISWVSTKGRCRYCKEPIGKFEIFIEAGLAAFFLVSFLAWLPYLGGVLEVVQFSIWLAAGVIMAMLFAYDSKWFLLPNVLTVPLAILGAVYLGLEIGIQGGLNLPMAYSVLGSLFIMSGLYGMLFVLSKGAWIGLGDVKLGVGLALFLISWQSAFLALFLANFIGVLIILPQLLRGKLNRKSHVPFGPLMIVGATIAVLFGPTMVDLYLGSLTGLFI